MDVEGRGKRPLRFCHTVQDGHTASEQIAYQALWNYARKYGRAEPNGATLVDVGLSQLCSLLGVDHKNVKRLIGSLQDKLAVEVVRQPDYRLAIPTRYRVFNYSQILERRRAGGLVWVIRTRAVRFVELATVQRLLSEQSLGELPTGDFERDPQLPAGGSPDLPGGQQPHAPAGGSPAASLNKEDTSGIPDRNATTTGFPRSLARNLNQWITIDDAAVRQIWDACRRGSPDCSEDEVLWFCRSKEALIRSGRIDNPIGLLIRSVPQFFANGGSTALEDYRREQAREQERERRRERQVAQMVIDDPESSEAELAWAREVLAPGQGSASPRVSGPPSS